MEIQENLLNMKTIISTLVMILLAAFITTTQAQKKTYYTEQEQIIEAAYNALDQEMKEGEILEWAKDQELKGAYTFDLAIRGKGEVVTVRAINREGGDIPSQNKLKDYLKTIRFPFKMPKNRSYKFQYEFKF